jgi:hypothetical protein
MRNEKGEKRKVKISLDSIPSMEYINMWEVKNNG